MTDEAQRARGCEVTTSPTERPALLPCPWCGSIEHLSLRVESTPSDDREVPFIACGMCASEGAKPLGSWLKGQGRSKLATASAITAWNTRRPSPALPAPAIAELAERVEILAADLVGDAFIVEFHDGEPEECLREMNALKATFASKIGGLVGTLAAPPATLEARVRGLEAEWRKEADRLDARGTMPTEADQLRKCADALAALLGKESP